MVKVKIYLNNQKVKGFEISGHAFCGPEGQDVVCAAVSMVSQTAILGLTNYLNLKLEGKVEKGFIKCFLPDLSADERLQADAILETMILGLESISKDYPNIIIVGKEEVASK